MSNSAPPNSPYHTTWNAPPCVSPELFAGLGGTAENSSAGSVPLDVERLLDRCLGSRQLADRVLQTFSERFPKEVEAIRCEVESSESERAAESAHRLKGACRTAGAEELAGLTEKLELAVKDSRWEDARRVAPEFATAWKRFESAREAFLHSSVAAMPSLMS